LGIRLSRKNDKSNGPVHVQIVAHDLSTAKFGMPPDVREILQTMWRFNPDQIATADAKAARRDLSLGEEMKPGRGPLGSNAEQVSEVKKARRKRS
jgi:hypothetical protein